MKIDICFLIKEEKFFLKFMEILEKFRNIINNNNNDNNNNNNNNIIIIT